MMSRSQAEGMLADAGMDEGQARKVVEVVMTLLDERISPVSEAVERLRGEVTDLHADNRILRAEFLQFGSEIKKELAEFKLGVNAEINALRVEVAKGFSDVSKSFVGQTRWMAGMILLVIAAISAIAKFVH